MINISDHTGTYQRTLLGGQAMTTLLGFGPDRFLQMNCEERARLKWNICLHRFKIYFWTEQASFDSPFPMISVLACEKPNSFELVQSLRNKM
ncbi:unnamed protein product, partial [Dicrocoelium dendriticum]